jgi:hypothetical protein
VLPASIKTSAWGLLRSFNLDFFVRITLLTPYALECSSSVMAVIIRRDEDHHHSGRNCQKGTRDDLTGSV